MWRLRHLVVVLSIVALGYYFSISFKADWKVLVPLGILLLLTYVGASLADPAKPPEKPPEKAPEKPQEAPSTAEKR